MSNKISDLHQTARNYAVAGIPVFPCIEGGKLPATSKGFKDATTDLGQIDAWWTSNPNYNVAIEPEQAGLCVVDLDPPVGEENWAKLVAKHGVPPDTREVTTPRGGRHLIFEGSLPSSASKLSEKIDTRGRGSYVLVPPSYIAEQGRSYVVSRDIDPAPLPGWVGEIVGRERERTKATIRELDLPLNIRRAESVLRGYVEAGDVAVSGNGGDTRTYQVCAEVMNLGLSEEAALQVISHIWNPACIPPWDEFELQTKIENAARYAQNEQGAWASPSTEEVYANDPALDKLIEASKSVEGERSKFYPYGLGEIKSALQPPAWIVEGLIQAKGLTQIVGPQKSFKTFLTLDLVLSIASGVESFAGPVTQGTVVYAVGENASAMGLKHIPAWQMLHERENDFPFYLVPAVPLAAEGEVHAFINEIKHLKPSLIVIDTATRAMRGLDENSAKDAGVFSQACDYIREQLDCAVLVVRHTGKDAEKGGRGSNVLDGDFDGTLQVRRHEKSMAVSMTVAEMRNAAEKEDPYTFEMKVLGASLVPNPITIEAFRTLVASDDPFDPKRIGKVLSELHAYGKDHGISSTVLVGRLTEVSANDTVEQRQQKIQSGVRHLLKASKTSDRLAGYMEGSGRETVWCLPAKSSD